MDPDRIDELLAPYADKAVEDDIHKRTVTFEKAVHKTMLETENNLHKLVVAKRKEDAKKAKEAMKRAKEEEKRQKDRLFVTTVFEFLRTRETMRTDGEVDLEFHRDLFYIIKDIFEGDRKWWEFRFCYYGGPRRKMIVDRMIAYLRYGRDMGPVLKSAHEKAIAMATVAGFSPEHPQYEVVVALGTLTPLLPWVIAQSGLTSYGHARGWGKDRWAYQWQKENMEYLTPKKLCQYFKGLEMMWDAYPPVDYQGPREGPVPIVI